MKKAILCTMVIIAGLAISSGLSAQPRPLVSLFPELAGWTRQGKVETFDPDNLYKHIDGAAENFLAYDFKQLAVQNYANAKKQALTAEIYFHGTPENAFGIYSSEKPLTGDYFSIGSQGYAEEGVLNFISDGYYVKLNGFDLGEEGRVILTSLAEKIARAIDGKNALPEMLAALPEPGRVANSERYILRNFLGYEFLHSAFAADYDLQGRKFQVFIMQAASEDDARAMLQKYAALDKGNPAPAVKPGALAIRDPYNGPLQLFWRGATVCGVIGQAPDAAALFAAIDEKLKKQ
jgi:hypothetical protein